MAKKQKQLLVIDDSLVFRESIELAGKRHNWHVHASDGLNDIEAWLVENRPSVVLLDWKLGKQQPEQFAQLLQDRGLTGKTLLLSADIDDDREWFVEEYGLVGIRLKPLDLRRLDEELELPPSPQEGHAISRSVVRNLRYLRDKANKRKLYYIIKMLLQIPVAVDILDKNFRVLWSNKGEERESFTLEQYLIAKWLQAEIAKDETCAVARRLDWDGEKGRFLESRLYSLDDNNYALERDWRGENEQPHDHEFLNLEKGNLTLDGWLKAVARLLAQRYAISRFRVYKISPLPYTQGLEEPHVSLVLPEFESGGGIEPDTDNWLKTGFQQNEIADIGRALEKSYTPAPELVSGTLQGATNPDIPRVRYGESGTYRVLFPVRHSDSEGAVALLAMDRRLDHLEGLQGFDREVVDLATCMASDQAGVLDEGQWDLMKGLVEDIGRRIAVWLKEDEEKRTVAWHEAISEILIHTFADAQSSPEMIYEGISQVCAALAKEWNRERKKGEIRISGHIRGTTPWRKQDKKGPPISSWCIVLGSDSGYWRVVAGWGSAYEECQTNGGQMAIPHAVVAQGEPWKAAVIQAFQTWSEKAEGTPCECLSEETRRRIGSWLGVPMKVEGKIQALMVVHSPHAHYFTRFHSQLMEYASKRLLPLLAAALRETRARDAFTASVMHEMKNESHGARMLVDRMQHKAGDTEWAGDLIKVRHYLDELNALGHDTLDIFRVGRGDRIEGSENREEATTTLGKLIENATLGWRSLYEDIELETRFPEELAAHRILVPHVQGFQRVLRVLLHNAFRHGRDWVRIAVRLEHEADSDARIQLTVTNGSYQDTVLGLDQELDSAVDRPSASPLVGGRLGLVVARQLATEAGGILGTLEYTEGEGHLGRAEITLSWPVQPIA